MAATRHWLTLCYSARFCVDKMPSIGRYSRRLLSVPTVLGTMIGAPPNSCSARKSSTQRLCRSERSSHCWRPSALFLFRKRQKEPNGFSIRKNTWTSWRTSWMRSRWYSPTKSTYLSLRLYLAFPGQEASHKSTLRDACDAFEPHTGRGQVAT